MCHPPFCIERRSGTTHGSCRTALHEPAELKKHLYISGKTKRHSTQAMSFC